MASEIEVNWRIGKSLLQRLQYILEGQCSTDVTFIVGAEVNQKRMRANRFMLSCGSQVFEAMFQKASKDQMLVVDDVDPETFMEILKFLYFEQATITGDNALNVLKAAKKFDLCQLVEKCSSFLKSSMDLENVCDILNGSLGLDEHDLRDSCMTFIRNTTEAVLKSKPFTSLSARRDGDREGWRDKAPPSRGEDQWKRGPRDDRGPRDNRCARDPQHAWRRDDCGPRDDRMKEERGWRERRDESAGRDEPGRDDDRRRPPRDDDRSAWRDRAPPARDDAWGRDRRGPPAREGGGWRDREEVSSWRDKRGDRGPQPRDRDDRGPPREAPRDDDWAPRDSGKEDRGPWRRDGLPSRDAPSRVDGADSWRRGGGGGSRNSPAKPISDKKTFGSLNVNL